MKAGPGKVKTRFKCGDVVLRIDTGRCGMCGDSIPTGSILRVMSDEDVAGVVRVQYPQADDEDEEIQDVMWYEIDHLPAKAKVEEFSDAVRVSMNGDAIATILTDIATHWALFISKAGPEKLPSRWRTLLTFKSHWGS